MGGGFFKFDADNGSTFWAHIRTSGPAGTPCPFPDFANPLERCGRRTGHLCDFPVSPSGRTTCDKPMCDRHRKHVSKDIDYCPDHAKEHA